MNDEDYLELIALVERELESIGLGDLADPALYAVRAEGTGELRVPPPQKRLVEMLQAFNRQLLIEDGSTYDRALERINPVLKEGKVAEAVVIPLEGEGLDPIPLSGAPRLAEVRQQLEALISVLRPVGRPAPRSER